MQRIQFSTLVSVNTETLKFIFQQAGWLLLRATATRGH